MPSIEPTPTASVPRGAGGTPGGIGTFFLGLVMVAAGGYLILNQVIVTGGWSLFGMGMGRGGFGLTLLPLLVGIGWLFYDGKSKVGWLLVALGSAILLANILMNMSMVFQSTSLWNVLVMLGLLFGGIGVVARSLKPHGDPPAAT